MIKQGRLDKPYNGVVDCTMRVLKTEGVYPFWRGMDILTLMMDSILLIIL